MTLNNHNEFQLKTEALWENYPPGELCSNLRALLIDYLEVELTANNPKEPNEFKYLTELNTLFKWLDLAALKIAKDDRKEIDELFLITVNFLDDHSPANLHSIIQALLVNYMPYLLNEGSNYQFNDNLNSFMALLEWLHYSSKLLNINKIMANESVLPV